MTQYPALICCDQSMNTFFPSEVAAVKGKPSLLVFVPFPLSEMGVFHVVPPFVVVNTITFAAEPPGCCKIATHAELPKAPIIGCHAFVAVRLIVLDQVFPLLFVDVSRA